MTPCVCRQRTLALATTLLAICIVEVLVAASGIGVTDDPAIFQLQRKRVAESPVILTKDEDLANLVTRLPPPQVLWMGVGNATDRVLREHRPTVLPQAMEALNEGVALVELARLR